MLLRFRQTFYLWFLFSISLHLLLERSFTYFGQKLNTKSKEKVEFEVIIQKNPTLEIFKKTTKAKKQVIEQEELALNSIVPKDHFYLGRFNQKVREETKAKNTGRFLNSPLNSKNLEDIKKNSKKKRHLYSLNLNQHSKREPSNEKTNKALTLNDLNPRFSFWEKDGGFISNQGLKKSLNNTSENTSFNSVQENPRTPSSMSQTSDHLEGVKEGKETLLNSREFVYYSFYQRVRENLRYHWESKLDQKIQEAIKNELFLDLRQNFKTKVIAILSQKGRLLHIHLIERSGVKRLDEAAIEAFQAAGPFPNPPQGMVDSNGVVKIRWDFILERS